MGRLPTIGNGAGGGAPNAHVRRLQALLLADGAKIEVDGRYGPKTLASVKAAQKRHKLTVDGIVGRGTWSALLGLAP